MADSNTVIEGTVKFRDGKKWKSRWCVMRKLSPVADCLHLQLYRDSKDRYKQGQTKASLSLQHFLGVETGFTLDKESNTIAILCQDVTVVLAFDTRERLIQWQVKIANNLGEDQQFLVQISSAPGRAKIAPGPARLHVQEYRFCLTVGVPPRLVGLWDITNLRRYGVVENRFCFEGGSRCGKGEGLYVFVTDQGEEITRTLQLASDGKMGSKRRPVTRNMSVMDSPRKSRPETRLSHVSCTDSVSVSASVQPQDSISMQRQPCCGCHHHHHQSTEDLHGWPSSETRPDSSDYGDTASVGDFADPHLQGDCVGWTAEGGLGRCASCISKLGAMSRSSTAANTPGTAFSPAWIMETSTASIKSGHAPSNACSTTSVSSHDSSSGQSDYSVPRLTTTDSWSVRGVSPSSQVERCPPGRPPKPSQLGGGGGQAPAKKKAPMPPPGAEQPCPCPHHRPPAYENYDIPRNFMVQPESAKGSSTPSYRISACSSEEYYDTPKSIKESMVVDTQYANYDTPPLAVAVRQPCACRTPAPPLHHCTRIVLDSDECSRGMACPCQRVMCWPSTWLSLPYCRRGNGIENTSVHLHKVKLDGEGKMPVMNSSGEVAVYATVDMSKKAKYRLQCEEMKDPDKENKPIANEANSGTPAPKVADCEENSSLNYVNLDLSNQEAEPKPGEGTNYVNLDFAQSLEYYENARDVLQRAGMGQTEERADNQLYVLDKNGVKICNKCGHACTTPEQGKQSGDSQGDYLLMGPGTGGQQAAAQGKPNPASYKFPGYLPMHPIPSSGNIAKPDLLKARLNRSFGLTERAASIPSLTGPAVERCRKRGDSEYQRVPGSAMLGINHSVSATTSPYLRRHPMASLNAANKDHEQPAPARKRSSSADSTRYLDDLESITERTASTASSTQVNETSINTSVDSLSSQIFKKLPSDGGEETTAGAITGQPTPADRAPLAEFESETEKEESLRSMVQECLSAQQAGAVQVRRSSSVPSKSGNRDSSSSNDSGVSTGSLKHRGADFAEFELPLTTALSSKRHHHALTQRLHSSQDCLHATLPRRSKSSDPLRELTFQFPKISVPAKSSSAEAELPICPNKREPKEYSSPSGDGALAVPYIDSRSTSSGTSDMSDYIETLSLSSHSSSDTPDSLRLGRIAATTLRPRSGKEYHKIDRYILEGDMKMKGLCSGISTVPEKSESPSPGYISSSPAN